MEGETYEEWRSRLKAWASRYRTLNQASEEMARRCAVLGEHVNPWTVRGHCSGKYREVGLRLYNAINQVIANAD